MLTSLSLSLSPLSHPWPFPGESRWEGPLVEEGLGCGGEERVLEEHPPAQTVTLQLVVILILKKMDPLWHSEQEESRNQMHQLVLLDTRTIQSEAFNTTKRVKERVS